MNCIKLLQPETDHASGYFDVAGFATTTLASAAALAAVFDHTLLKPEATRDQVVKVCEEAATFRFACAMVNPAWVSLAHSVMAGSGVPVGVVVGFPLGANLATTKREEALALIKLGAHELDMVMNLGLLKSGMNALVEQDIRGVVQVAHEAGALVKGHLGNLAFERGRETARVRAGARRGRGFSQDQHRLFYGRRHCGGRCDPAWRGWESLRSQSFWWHSHPERCPRHAGSRGYPDRRQRQCCYPPRVPKRSLNLRLSSARTRICSLTTEDGCPMFAPAYMGRKRGAAPSSYCHEPKRAVEGGNPAGHLE